MQKALLFLLSVFLFAATGTQAQSHLVWSTTASVINSQITDPRSFAVDGNGNNYSVNFTESAISSFTSYVFYAHNANGVKLWEYVNDSCLLNCNDKYFNIIPLDNDGAIFIGAYDDITGTQVRIKRINNQGSLVWQQYWISPFLSVQPVKSMLDNNGHIIVAMNAEVNPLDMEDFCVAKFDTAAGLLDWHIELPDDGTSLNPLSEIISGLTIDANNNVYCVGTGSNGGTVKNYYFKISDTGALEYRLENTYDGPNSSNFAIETNSFGSFYTLGFTGAKTQVEKYNEQSGSLIWSKEVDKDSAELSNVGMAIVGNDIYVATNFTYFNSGGSWDNKHYMVSQLNSSGTIQWQKEYFTDIDSLAIQDGFGGAVQMSVCDASLYILSAQHLDQLNNILILHKTDLSGITQWYDTASIDTSPGFINFDQSCDIYITRPLNNFNLTEKYSNSPLNSIAIVSSDDSFDVYPNPIQNEFTINLKNTRRDDGVVSVYNSLGELILSKVIFHGENNISLSGQTSGIYFIHLILNNEKFSKMIVKL